MKPAREIAVSEAIREATEQAMERDPSVLVLGLNVDDHKTIYGTTKGLVQRFGRDRVVDTPLSEDGMTGVAVGMAMAGLRPIHVHIRMDFLMLAMNQIVNIAAKARYMYGGRVSAPLVVRAVIGRSWGQGPQHSQGLYPLFCHVPGLIVAAPTTPYDAKGLLTTALRGGDPVLFVEHRFVHMQKGPVPEKPYSLPFGKARILSPGRDVTLVGVAHMAVECLRAERLLAQEGVRAEVIDPVTLSPLDMPAITGSVARTKAILTVDNGWVGHGLGAEILARLAESGALKKGFRAKRLGFANTVCPTAKNLENLYYPSASQIAAAAWSLARPGRRAPGFPASAAPEVVAFKGPF